MKPPHTSSTTRVQQQPNGTVRRSQMVTTFGPGAMVDLVNDAVLVGGLDFWSYDKDIKIPHIDEPRLSANLVQRFRQNGRDLSMEHTFRAPPIGSDREPTKFCGVSVLEFPQWFVCQNADCRALVRNNGLQVSHNRYVHVCSQSKKAELVPVRFVSACRKGHLDDFNWIYFVHLVGGKERCASPSLTFQEGATGDFNEIRVECACGAKAPLSTTYAIQIPCSGHRPWLGPEGREECTEHVRLLVRTATNSYFPLVESALSIPDPARELENAVRSHLAILRNATKEALPAFRLIDGVREAIAPYPDDDVLATIKLLRDNKPLAISSLRTPEFKQFMAQSKEVPGDLAPSDETFFARSVTPKDGLPDGVSRIVLATKLREVAAQVGFTRLEPVGADMQGSHELKVEVADLGLTTNWLPATEMRGEGVFLALDERRVANWEKSDEVKARGDQLLAGYKAWAKGAQHPPPFPGVRFFMLHSLSHLLISAISLECGYAASAIRERIYCAPSGNDDTPMAAILLVTGTSGTEGTLGGLVEQGRRIREHLDRAWGSGRLCSNDPVCGTHSPEDDHAERFLEGAACHGCLFIAECSCERFNRYLDRALVVPTIGHPAELAFFSKRP